VIFFFSAAVSGYLWKKKAEKQAAKYQIVSFFVEKSQKEKKLSLCFCKKLLKIPWE